MSSEEVKLGQRVYFKHPDRHCRLECTVKSIHPEPLPSGDRAIKIQNGDSGDWTVGLHQIEDADWRDEYDAREKYANVLAAWESGLRKCSEIAAKTKAHPMAVAGAIRACKNRGFIHDDQDTASSPTPR